MQLDVRASIEKRIDDATPSVSKFNYWPTDMEVIKTTVFDLSVAEQAYNAGHLMGRENYAYRQIQTDRVPYEFPARHWMPAVHFMLANSKGQSDDPKTRNLFAVFEANMSSGMSYPGKKVVVAIEIGCKHDYEVRAPYNCYREGKCKKCGHTWACDSSG